MRAPGFIASGSAFLAIGLVLAACGGAGVVDDPGESAPTLPMCDEVPRITADPDRYGDRPVYVANEMPVSDVQAWAETQPGFETLWIDRDHNGWITVAFSADADARQADLDERFPGAGVVAVEVDWTMGELAALQASLVDRLPDGFVTGSGILVTQGVVTVGIGSLTAERIAAASRALEGERVCLEGIDPELVPEPGPQPQAGGHWRLLADDKTGQVYRTGLATDVADLRALWAEAGISTPVPEVDFESEVVIWFGAVYGSSCPNLRMDDVVIERGVVHPLIVNLDVGQACTDDANPHAYVVAVARDAFPSEGFVIRLQADPPAPGVVDQETVVSGDVTISGSYVRGVREELPEQSGPPDVEPGGFVEPGFVWSLTVGTHCGVEFLGELNGVMWRAESASDQTDFMPDEWRPVVDEAGGELVLDVLLTPGDPPVLEATAAGHTERYLPTDVPRPGCD